MFKHNDQAKPRFPLSLDGRGARGEGVLLVLSSFLFALLSAAPAAWADNECGLDDPSLNGALADSYDCTDASYAGGVTYEADGDLTIDFNNDATSTIGGTGIMLTGDGSENITFDSNDPTTTIRSLSGMDGDLLGITTVDGDILITTSVMDGDTNNAENVDRAIFARSTGAGDIDITTTGLVDVLSTTNPETSIGIEARSNSGDIEITTNATVAGNQYGILAETGGSGALTVTANGQVNLPGASGAQSLESSVASIDASAGTGLLTVNVTSNGNISGGGGGGRAIRTDSNGGQVINVASGAQVRSGGIDLNSTGSIVVNNAGSIRSGGDSGTIRAAGVGGELTLNNDNTIDGILDFTGLTEGYVFNNNAGAQWRLREIGVTELGTDGEWNNAGTINLRTADLDSALAGTPGTVVSAPGTAFTGTGDSLLQMYTFLDGKGQASCDGAAVADCLDLSGGTTAGQTAIQVFFDFTTLVTGPLGAVTSANSGIVLADVGGGTSQADHFVLAPSSGRYDPPDVDSAFYAEDPIYGAVLDVGGILDYTLLYNPNTQQHILATVPQRQAIEYVAYIDEATSIWHTTSEAIAGRQAEVRDGATGDIWFRVVGESGERDATPTHTSHGNSFQYEHGYSLDTDALILGSDWVSGDDHVFGLHFGAVRSSLDFDDSDTRDKSKGAVFGAYGGWWNESGLSLDGTINANFVKLDHNVTGFENSETSYISLGARVEAGWRLPLLGDPLYVQPLATAAYVTTDFEDLELTDNTIGFEDATSLRGALGVRLGGETSLNNDRIGKLGYWLTARAWEENADEGEIQFATRDGGHLAIKDDRSGSFEEVNFGVSVSNKDDTVSGYLSGSAVSGDDSDSFNVSIGARLNW